MKIYIIEQEEKLYWCESEGTFTENNKNITKKLAHWSSFQKESFENRDFFILKALMIYLAMLFSGIKPKLESSRGREDGS